MATIWIHRCSGSDIIVPAPSKESACKWALCFMNMYASEGYTLDDKDSWCVSSPYLQISVHGPDFFHQGWSLPGESPPDSWNHEGTVFQYPREAFLLGLNREPVGFIPYESEGLWKKETRTKEELDAELDEYMADEEEYEERFQHFVVQGGYYD